jgi:CRISPR-associated protein Cmr1
MSKVEIKVQFETITPLWTGDAWMENNEIRPSSLIGSLRFWFEVICYFGGICSEKDFDKEKGRFEKKISQEEFKKKLLKHGSDFRGQIEALKELEVPLPAIIFGTTGWKSLIEIKEINFNNENFEEVENTRIIPGKNWFWKKIEYYGELTVIFRVPEEIKETIFFPLLNFMDKYGYWGGGWNIGYGRLRVRNITKINKFDFSNLSKKEEVYIEGNDGQENKIVEPVGEKNLLTQKNQNPKIIYWKYNVCNFPVIEMLKNLIIEKSNLRRSLNDQKERHYIFGKTGNIQGEDLPQGSKILPYINRLDNDSYESGFLSIAGILRLYQEQENGQQ